MDTKWNKWNTNHEYIRFTSGGCWAQEIFYNRILNHHTTDPNSRRMYITFRLIFMK